MKLTTVKNGRCVGRVMQGSRGGQRSEETDEGAEEAEEDEEAEGRRLPRRSRRCLQVSTSEVKVDRVDTVMSDTLRYPNCVRYSILALQIWFV